MSMRRSARAMAGSHSLMGQVSTHSFARCVAMVEHQVIAVRISEERHVADAGVKRLAGEADALLLQRRARRANVISVERDMPVLLGRELHPDKLRLPDAQTGLACPELE